MKATSTVIVNPYDKNKLSALIKIDYYQPVKFNYTVHGKSSNVDFYYASDRYAVNPEVTVVGLYANYANTVTLTLYTEQGETQTSVFTISTEGQDY
ncbi:aryl-sulfate sulfotransferase N-terminal domain-containing protein [Enterobacter hormaechei subsp. hormaechei]